ncbi:protein kinase family protein [Isoptericola croceus]|uniref:protein kinase family protein n=1 Tax=Isoptericola croceus TaxID=3031406 RepID=UPI0023F8A516|nr:protein kinase family protein [Isoptericola croceus]
MFAVLHRALNQHFEAINGRARTTKHYWADHSRELLNLIEEINQDLHDLKRAGDDIDFDPRYEQALERCEPWLTPSGGSTVPDDFESIEIVKYEPVFAKRDGSVSLTKSEWKPDLKLVGEGSYANVFSYIDPDYDTKFALKRAKRGIDQRDLIRFRQEFEVLKRLSFPYIVEVYKYGEERDEYRLEYCDDTLRSYIRRKNSELKFSSRRRIALQFLYGLNYLHSQNVLHRDISLQNIMLKVYDSGAVIVKLSDFGLVKEGSSTYTRSGTEVRGTIVDPALDSFKDYSVANEIYSIGWVLAFIFSGRESLTPRADKVGEVVARCTDPHPEDRFSTVLEIIACVENMSVSGALSPTTD